MPDYTQHNICSHTNVNPKIQRYLHNSYKLSETYSGTHESKTKDIKSNTNRLSLPSEQECNIIQHYDLSLTYHNKKKSVQW